MTNQQFYYFSLPYHDDDDASVGNFTLRIPAGIKTEETLMIAYEVGGKFPGYFGRNWNALYDCLCDFTWIKNQNIVLAHYDVPLTAEQDQLTYLRLLYDASVRWEEWARQILLNQNLPPSDAQTNIVDHTLQVRFPLKCKSRVEALLSASF